MTYRQENHLSDSRDPRFQDALEEHEPVQIILRGWEGVSSDIQPTGVAVDTFALSLFAVRILSPIWHALAFVVSRTFLRETKGNEIVA